jgi:hypothetical protein
VGTSRLRGISSSTETLSTPGITAKRYTCLAILAVMPGVDNVSDEGIVLLGGVVIAMALATVLTAQASLRLKLSQGSYLLIHHSKTFD